MMLQTEYEEKLNRVRLHICRSGQYEEDYQLPMIRMNKIPGILPTEGCEMEGQVRYSYEIGSMMSMKVKYEKTSIKKNDIMEFIAQLLQVSEELQRYMLNPECLLLNPEYIFYKEEQWYFCYLPGNDDGIQEAFHGLTEYFVKMLDYGDDEGIFLAYELHKATLREHYDLGKVMEEYEARETERLQIKAVTNLAGKADSAEKQQPETTHGNIFSLTEEEEEYEEEQENPVCEKYTISPAADTVREDGSWWKSWRKTAERVRRTRWGSWNDLITEADQTR